MYGNITSLQKGNHTQKRMIPKHPTLLTYKKESHTQICTNIPQLHNIHSSFSRPRQDVICNMISVTIHNQKSLYPIHSNLFVTMAGIHPCNVTGATALWCNCFALYCIALYWKFQYFNEVSVNHIIAYADKYQITSEQRSCVTLFWISIIIHY